MPGNRHCTKLFTLYTILFGLSNQLHIDVWRPMHKKHISGKHIVSSWVLLIYSIPSMLCLLDTEYKDTLVQLIFPNKSDYMGRLYPTSIYEIHRVISFILSRSGIFAKHIIYIIMKSQMSASNMYTSLKCLYDVFSIIEFSPQYNIENHSISGMLSKWMKVMKGNSGGISREALVDIRDLYICMLNRCDIIQYPNCFNGIGRHIISTDYKPVYFLCGFYELVFSVTIVHNGNMKEFLRDFVRVKFPSLVIKNIIIDINAIKVHLKNSLKECRAEFFKAKKPVLCLEHCPPEPY